MNPIRQARRSFSQSKQIAWPPPTTRNHHPRDEHTTRQRVYDKVGVHGSERDTNTMALRARSARTRRTLLMEKSLDERQAACCSILSLGPTHNNTDRFTELILIRKQHNATGRIKSHAPPPCLSSPTSLLLRTITATNSSSLPSLVLPFGTLVGTRAATILWSSVGKVRRISI